MKILVKYLNLIFVAIICNFSSSFSQWVSSNGQFFQSEVMCTAGNPDYLFVGTNGDGFWRSTNAGIDWEPSNVGLDGLQIIDMAVYKNNIFVVVKSFGFWKGIFLSTNSGGEWNAVNTNLPNIDCECVELTVDEFGQAFVVIGTWGGKMFISDDLGKTWGVVKSDTTITSVSSLVSNGNKLFAGNYYGLFYSEDNGRNWSIKNREFSGELYVADSINIFAYLHVANVNGTINGSCISTDGGLSWSLIMPYDIYMGFTSLTTDGKNIFASWPGAGIYRSTNNGASWSFIISTWKYPNVNKISIQKINGGNQIFITTRNAGFYRSTDDCNTWSKLNLNIGSDFINGLMVDNSIIYGATSYYGVIRSLDDGKNWEMIYPGRVLSLIKKNKNIFAGSVNNGLLRSTDDGASWSVVRKDLIGYSFAVNGNSLFVMSQAGIYRSMDDGINWTLQNSALRNENLSTLLAVKGKIFAGTQGSGLYCSTNNGDSWDVVNMGISTPYITAIAGDASNIYVGTPASYRKKDGKIFRSSNNGDTWIEISNNFGVRSLAVSGSLIFADYRGINLSKNYGKDWDTINAKIPLMGRSMVIKDNYLFVGEEYGMSRWEGIYSLSVKSETKSNPSQYILEQNYPNPFNPSTTFSYSVPKASNVKLLIYDLLGRKVTEVLNEYHAPGTYRRSWNALDLSSGIYFYQMQAGEFSEIKKLILLR